MELEKDKWREMSQRLGEKMERPRKIVRFSRRLLIAAAVFLAVLGIFRVI
jgi:hypothetical protein